MQRNCTICVVKTKSLISFAVTAKLICAFVFAYADCWFSHAAAQIILNNHFIILRIYIFAGKYLFRVQYIFGVSYPIRVITRVKYIVK